MVLINDDEDEVLEHPSSNASPSAPAASAAPDAAASSAAAPAACPEMSIFEADVSESDDHDEELDADMNVQQLMGKCKMLINKHKKVKQKQKQLLKQNQELLKTAQFWSDKCLEKCKQHNELIRTMRIWLLASQGRAFQFIDKGPNPTWGTLL